MNVIVDTSVWSLALRRRRPATSAVVRELAELVQEGRAAMMGAVRQEILSGVKREEQYETLRGYLRPFPDIVLGAEDYEEAASFFNRCRTRGVQGSNTDFLLCSVAVRRRFAILTTDADFLQFAKIVPIDLHSPRASLSGSM